MIGSPLVDGTAFSSRSHFISTTREPTNVEASVVSCLREQELHGVDVEADRLAYIERLVKGPYLSPIGRCWASAPLVQKNFLYTRHIFGLYPPKKFLYKLES